MGTTDSKPIINPPSFDDTWENLYSQGKHFNRYPYTSVVSFVYGQLSQQISFRDLHALEVGCGAGAFLLPISISGANVYGIDYSDPHIQVCKKNSTQQPLIINRNKRNPHRNKIQLFLNKSIV